VPRGQRPPPTEVVAKIGAAQPARRGPPGPWVRLAVTGYELALLFGVVFATVFVLIAALHWTYPLSRPRTLTLQGAIFVIVGVYFVHCWRTTGQTLAMKTWQLRLVDVDGRPPTTGRALRRYLLASAVLLGPGFLLVAASGANLPTSLLLLAAPLGAVLVAARRDPERQWLHDRLLGTRIEWASPGQRPPEVKGRHETAKRHQQKADR